MTREKAEPPKPGTLDTRAGASFKDADVVANYPFRPPYPDAVFNKLLAIAPRRTHLLDLGCGPGKIARPLSRHFKHVTAVDPSRNMIELGRSQEDGDAPNIRWVQGLADDFPTGGERFDLTVAAVSIHWTDHARLFPRLAAHAAPGHRVAVISGDAAHKPQWEQPWLDFLAKWVPMITGAEFDPGSMEAWGSRYRTYLDVEGDEFFLSNPVEQRVEDFVRCQHSRQTFAPSWLGARMAEFDAELKDLLSPFAVHGHLSFVVRSRVVWGAIRET